MQFSLSLSSYCVCRHVCSCSHLISDKLRNIKVLAPCDKNKSYYTSFHDTMKHINETCSVDGESLILQSKENTPIVLTEVVPGI